MQAALSQYGKIISVKYPTYPPPFENIKKGVRQYRMELNKAIPNGLRVGNHIVWVKYLGQERSCNKCGEKGHLFAECPFDKCSHCLQLGHKSQDCTNDVTCSICGVQGHVFRACPKSFANVVTPGGKWTSAGEQSTEQVDKSVDNQETVTESQEIVTESRSKTIHESDSQEPKSSEGETQGDWEPSAAPTDFSARRGDVLDSSDLQENEVF
ncbi:zinc finger protein [Branchiostoma belcheri]|nr:zinc finger protein [Branchiostoma belcheri]